MAILAEQDTGPARIPLTREVATDVQKQLRQRNGAQVLVDEIKELNTRNPHLSSWLNASNDALGETFLFGAVAGHLLLRRQWGELGHELPVVTEDTIRQFIHLSANNFEYARRRAETLKRDDNMLHVSITAIFRNAKTNPLFYAGAAEVLELITLAASRS